MSLNKKTISLIKRKKMKLAIAESCTGGMLSSTITAVSGSSKVFTMGLVTYSNQAKTSILKVPQKIIKKYGRLSSLIYVSVPKDKKIYNDSLKLFATKI